jgi:putative tryptophan/tyrosine transport system substrate-binding protein
MITRRKVLVGLGVGSLSTPLPAFAQQKATSPKVGVLWHAGSAEEEKVPLGGLVEGFRNLGYVDGKNILLEHREFREGLRELGYVEGQNVVIEFRIGTLDELPRLAEELVRSKVDVIVASASSAGIAAKTATTSIPIVFTSLSHPVEIGLIKSLARPGGNITGVTVNAGATITKRLELLRELVPTLKQVAVLTHPAHPTDPVQRRETEEAARALRLQLKPAAVRGPEDFEAAFKAVSGAGALLNIDTPLFTTYRTQFAELAARNRLPAIWSNRIIVEAGGLMSYGTYIPALFRRAAIYVDKVLKGARPGDLPVEQPTKFELVINLKTAKALGLTIPPSVLARADEVIE